MCAHKTQEIVCSYTRIDPAQEIARMRHSLSLLETYVFPNQRASISTRRPSEVPAFIVPKKESVDYDVSPDKDSAAPGMLAGQGQGGLYAGQTSVATHLLIVTKLLVLPPPYFLTYFLFT